MNKVLTLFLSFILVSTLSFGQSLNAFEKSAREALANNDYYSALIFYQKAAHIEPTRLDLAERVADAATGFGALSIAEAKYSSIANNPSGTRDPKILFKLAEVKRNMGKYEEAKEVYNKFIQQSANNAELDAMVAKAKTGISESEWAIDIKADSTTSYKVMKPKSEINTPYSDFSPVPMGDTLYYSSLKFEKPRDDYPVER
ncbi:MAG: tetratricopeptide repeat protein, partial [Bacteroidota bacterium]